MQIERQTDRQVNYVVCEQTDYWLFFTNFKDRQRQTEERQTEERQTEERQKWKKRMKENHYFYEKNESQRGERLTVTYVRWQDLWGRTKDSGKISIWLKTGKFRRETERKCRFSFFSETEPDSRQFIIACGTNKVSWGNDKLTISSRTGPKGRARRGLTTPFPPPTTDRYTTAAS